MSQLAAKVGSTLRRRCGRAWCSRNCFTASASSRKPAESVRPGTRRVGQFQRVAAAANELNPKIGFHRLHLLADRRRRHMEFCGRRADTAQPRHGLERAQRGQHWHAERHEILTD